MNKVNGLTDSITLKSMINVDEFSIVQNELAGLVDVSIVTVGTQGMPVGELSNFTTFCHMIRSSPLGRRACEECDRVASLRALRLGRPQTYDCHCGLKDCTAPIVVDGLYLGGVLGGQVFVREEDRNKMDLGRIAREFELPLKKLEQAAADIFIVSEDYLKRSLRFYSFIANYFAETGLKNLIQQRLTRERQEFMQLQQIAKEQELKRMHAQMNPHFLFNALNSIARTAMLEEASDTENLIYDLSKYLRYTIKNTNDTPKLSQELDNLQNYLSIQKTRFGDRITFTISIDEELMDCGIPSMTLQPIVENAIIHGLEGRPRDGRVEVSGQKSADGREMELTVTDNGIGFPESVLKLFQGGGRLAGHEELGLGLINTHVRIQHMYGEKYGLSIESEPGRFSRVRIRLPRYVEKRSV